MRRASSRVPKRSLEPDFETTQPLPNPKSRAARRGPVGASKARKASFTGTGTVVARPTDGEQTLQLSFLKYTSSL